MTRYRTAALGVCGLLLAVWLAPLGRAQEINPSVRLDGAPLKMDAPAILDVSAGRTLVPIRPLAEPLGYSVSWDEATRTVLAERNGRYLEFRIGSRDALVNGLPVTLSVAPRLVKGRALIPLRFFAQFAGADVSWDEETQSVDITSPTSRTEQADAGWALPQAGIRRTGYNDGATFGNKAIPMWDAAMPGTGYTTSAATTGEGLVFTAGPGQQIQALNRENGAEVWAADLPSTVSPVYGSAQGLLFVISGPHDATRLYALEAASGAVRWFAALGGRAVRQSPPLLIGSQVLVNVPTEGSSSVLIAFDAASGSKLWQATVRGTGAPAAFGARLFLTDDYGGIYAYRTTDGSPLWSRPGESKEREYGQSELLVDNGRVYFANGVRVMALDEATGRLAWERSDINMAGGVASDGDRLWVTVRDGVVVLDSATGQSLHYPAICSTYASSPVLSRSHAFVSCDGSIYAIARQGYAVTEVGQGKGPLSLDGDRLYYQKGQATFGVLMALPEN